MLNALSFNEKLARSLGAFLMITALVCNEWSLAKLFSPDGKLLLTTRILIGFFDLFCLILGWSLWRRRDLKILLKVAFSFGCVVLLLFLLEGLLEFTSAKLERENLHGSGSYRLNANLNFRNVRTNSHGMRWKEVQRAKGDGIKRVAFVGDSFTFGCCANTIEQSFVGVFDSRMHNDFETLNFGVGGYGLADMYLLLKEEVLSFHPDYVFLMFFNGNDISDTYLSLDNDRILGVERWDDVIEKVPEAYRGSFTERTLDALSGTKLHGLYLSSKETLGKADRVVVYPYDFNISQNFLAATYWSRIRYPPAAKRALDLSLGFLKRIHEICIANNIQLIIGSIPFSSQVYAREVVGPDFDIRYPQKYVYEFASGRSIPYIDILPVLRDYGQNTNRQLFTVDGHFNNEGHRLVGEELVRFFRKNVEVDQMLVVKKSHSVAN